MTQYTKKEKLTKNEKPLSRVSPVQYSPRRQSRWVLADYGGKDLWKRRPFLHCFLHSNFGFTASCTNFASSIVLFFMSCISCPQNWSTVFMSCIFSRPVDRLNHQRLFISRPRKRSDLIKDSRIKPFRQPRNVNAM